MKTSVAGRITGLKALTKISFNQIKINLVIFLPHLAASGSKQFFPNLPFFHFFSIDLFFLLLPNALVILKKS